MVVVVVAVVVVVVGATVSSFPCCCMMRCVSFGRVQVGLTDDVPLKYAVTIRDMYTTVKKADISLIDGH